MKEMLGGCSVCCDETGWAENPLVYCDGPNCNVAVHQACYGIRTVPKGEWFCRKCEACKDKSFKVKCELCPSRDGALKPTENGNWAHVVCALYIPEVTFMDVTTMEPVKLSAIPRDRFNRVCYICEEKNKLLRVTTYGACMSCNKSGCRLGFHVTCAQSTGHLCEEAGNYYDNVKYVGYCKHHFPKSKKNNIKHIAPYRPQNQSENSSSDLTPEKQDNLSSPNISTDSQTSKSKRKLTIINNLGVKIANHKKIKDVTTQNTQSEDQTSGPHVISTHPSGNLVISIGTKFENKTSTSKKQSFEDLETEGKQSAKYQKTKNAMSITKSENDQSSNGLKIIQEPNLHHIEHKNKTIKSNNLVNLIQMPDTNALKKETSIISSPSDNKQFLKTEVTDNKGLENNAPHMLGNSLNPSSTMAQNMANTLNEEIEIHKKFNNESNLSTNTSKSNLIGPQIHRRNQRPQNQPETPRPQGSASSWSSFTNGVNNNNNNNNNNNTQALEDLLERQWEQGGAFMMEQAQHFDVASLLTCLYQLKSENVNLEDELAAITRRRDHLMAVNARLAIPLTPQSNRNRGSVPPTNNHINTAVSVQSPRSNFHPNLENIDSSSQHRYQNHSTHNRHPVHHSSNNIPSQVVIRGGVVHDPRPDNRRQINQNTGVLSSNPMYQATAQQPPNMTLPRHQMGMDGQPKHS